MFDAIACAYDLLAATPTRLHREGPFLESWAGSATRILDLACGTGVHAALFAAAGTRRITALDLSAAMLGRGRTVRDHPGISWVEGDMRRPPPGPFERVLILGNALNLLPDRQAMAGTLAAARQVLVPTGRLLLQVVNPRHPGQREARHVVRRATVDGVDLTLVKTLVPQPGVTLLSLAVYARHGDGTLTTGGEQAVLQELEAEELDALCAQAGFQHRRRWGGLDGSLFDAATSSDVVLDAQVEHAS